MNNEEPTLPESGLITAIWGPHMWISLHCIAYCYPLNPTPDDKKRYKEYFELAGQVLPCFHCRDSYGDFIKTGTTQLNDDVMKNRETLTKWLYCVHEAVNKKLGVNYGVSYDEVSARYNSYRASCNSKDIEKKKSALGCDAEINKKTISYKVENTKECPIIPIKIAKHFIKYGRLRNLEEKEFSLINQLAKKYDTDTEMWKQRNDECYNISKDMKLKGTRWIENEGKWKDFPTIDETKLILRLSSNISLEKLIEIIKKLPNCNCEYSKIYYLVK